VSELPPGWTSTQLDVVADWGSGGTPKADIADYYGGSIPWAVIGDLNEGLVGTTARTITDAGLSNSSAKMVDDHVVLVAMYGSIGKLGLPTIPMATNQAIAFARPRCGVANRLYLFYYLMHARHALTTAGKGATQQNISQTVLKAWPIPLAPLAEQDRIVAAIEEQFSRLDAAETVLQNALHRLKALRTSAIAAAYKGDWPRTTLGEIAEITGGVTKDSKREGDPSFVEVPYLRVANVQRGYLDLTEVSTIRVSPEKAQILMLQPGDVLFNEGGDRDKLGRGWVWSGEIDRCIHQNHVFRARVLKGFDPRFVSWHGNTFGQGWFDTHGRQTTNLASLNLTTLKSFPVPAPPLADQLEAVAEIERQLSIIDATTNVVKSAFIQGKALRRAILERAFSGKLLPQDPNDEPASVLLERVVAERASSNGAKHAKARSQPRRKVTV